MPFSSIKLDGGPLRTPASTRPRRVHFKVLALYMAHHLERPASFCREAKASNAVWLWFFVVGTSETCECNRKKILDLR